MLLHCTVLFVTTVFVVDDPHTCTWQVPGESISPIDTYTYIFSVLFFFVGILHYVHDVYEPYLQDVVYMYLKKHKGMYYMSDIHFTIVVARYARRTYLSWNTQATLTIKNICTYVSLLQMFIFQVGNPRGCYITVVTLCGLYTVLVITVFLLKIELTYNMRGDISHPSAFP